MPSTKIHAYDSNVPTTAVAVEPTSDYHQNSNATTTTGEIGREQDYEYHPPNNNSYYSNDDYPTKPSPSPHSSYNNNSNNLAAGVVVTNGGSTVPTVASVTYPRYVHIESRKPVTLSYCPNCAKDHVSTYTQTKANGVTMICVVVGVVVFWPLFWVPLVAKPMKQTNHYCKNCGVKVGRVKPFQ